MQRYFRMLLSIAFLFSPLILLAQDSRYDETIKITPPSPDAVSLGKYGAIPVSLYSGLPQVNIPLYNTKVGDIDLDISLSYMGGGVKVEEIAPWVGLGWTLNAGGVITRSVKGKADDGTSGYFDPYLGENPRPTGSSYTLNDISKWRLECGYVDGESDAYYFNFGKYTGSFYFDSNKQPRFFNHTNLKIIPYINTTLVIDSFKVVTETGIEYVFDQKEQQSSSSLCQTDGQPTNTQYSPSATYTSSWYLSKIRSPRGHLITFEYDATWNQVTYQIKGSERRYARKENPNNLYDNHFTKSNVRCDAMLFTTFTKTLKKISFSNGSIVFNKGADRTDVAGLKSLGYISVSSALGVMRQFSFNYHYYSNRFMLDNIVERTSNAQDKPPYKFTYNESQNLPDRLSNAQDHWGYYNGHNENGTLIPSYTLQDSYIRGANRNVDTTYNKLGSLTKIDYPTGGSTILEFEPNVANNVNNYPLYNQVNKVQSMYTYPTDVQVPNWSYSGLVPTDTLDFTINTAGTNPEGLQINGVYADISMKIPYNYDPNQPGTLEQMGARYELWDLSEGTVIVNNTSFGAPVSTQQYAPGNVAYSYQKAGKILLKKQHQYRLIHSVKPNIYNRFNSFPYYFLIQYQQDTTQGNNNIIVGGLRIKKLMDIDSLASKKIEKHYYYTEGNSSSGYLLDYPRYFYDYFDSFQVIYAICGVTQSKLVNVAYKVALSNAYYPLATTKSAYLGYKTVTEVTNDTLKTVYNYTSPADYNNQDRYEWNGVYLPISSSESMINSHPESQYRAFDWKRGLLLKKEDFKFLNGSYSPLRVETNYYSINNDTNKPNYHEAYNYTASIFSNDWHGKETPANGCLTPRITSPYTYGFPICTMNFYRNDSGYTQLDSTVIQEYDQANLAVIQKQTVSYAYDTLSLQPKQIVNKGSTGDILTTNVKYPLNYTLASATSGAALGLKNLAVKNIITEPVETYITRTDAVTNTRVFVSGQLKTYKADKPVPDSVYVLESKGDIPGFQASAVSGNTFTKNARYKSRFVFDSYTTKGNLTQSTYIGGSSTAYQWGYNQEYPVMQVNNALLKDVWYEGFEESGGNSSANDAKAGRYSKTGGYTKNMTGLTPGRYTLTYWRKSSGNWALVISDNLTVSTDGSYSISVTGQVDEIRFHPKTAAMTTYTYDALIGMTTSNDAKNNITYYEYDGFQRLKNIKDQSGNIVKALYYHYKGQ